MNSTFEEHLNQLSAASPSAYADLMACMRQGRGKKGELLLQVNEVCKNLVIVETGLVRHYRYDEEGREYNSWFSFEGDIVLPVGSFLNKTPSKEGNAFLEDSTYQYISHNHLFPLSRKHHLIETLLRELLGLYYVEMEDRMHRIQVYSAEKKYNFLLTQRPQILERISQVHVASYLGISRETLSRIRAKQRKA